MQHLAKLTKLRNVIRPKQKSFKFFKKKITIRGIKYPDGVGVDSPVSGVEELYHHGVAEFPIASSRRGVAERDNSLKKVSKLIIYASI